MNIDNRFFKTPDYRNTDFSSNHKCNAMIGGKHRDSDFSRGRRVSSSEIFNQTNGFSLIEMIVVVAILAVMVLVLAPKLLSYNERSRAEKDNSSMDEVVNAIQLALADQEVYDEVLRFSTVDNVSCYVDTNSEANYSKIITKSNPNGVDQYTFLSDARTLDETPYFAAGNMRGVTITFAPDKGSNGSDFDLKQGVVNQYIQVSGNQRFGAMPKLYNRVRSSVGDVITNTSQTYRNSEYTVFIVMGTIGGNDESAQDATKFYGQWSGTNLPAQVQYQIVSDRTVGDTGNTIVDIDDNAWNETNGSKLTLKPGDLNGGGSYSPNTATGNQTEPSAEIEPIICDPGLYDSNDSLIVSWEESGINNTCSNARTIIKNNYPTTAKVIIGDEVTSIASNAFMNCQTIREILIPDSVTFIGEAAFGECRGLKTIEIPKSVTMIQAGAIWHCYGLISVIVNSANPYFNDGNDSNCIIETASSKLIAGCDIATIPFGVKTIGENAFAGCKKITSINIPGSVLDIENYAFDACSELQSVVIPDGVVTIGEASFRDCDSLTSVVIGKGVKSIANAAFVRSDNLNEVIFKDTETWYIGDSIGSAMTKIGGPELENSFTAATYLTSTYVGNYWTKIDNAEILNFKISQGWDGCKISDTIFECEKNMTWRQWVNSEYNQCDIYIEGDLIYYPDYESQTYFFIATPESIDHGGYVEIITPELDEIIDTTYNEYYWHAGDFM